MSCRSPRKVIVAYTERAPLASHDECLPIGRDHRSVNRRTRRLWGVFLRVLNMREGWDREGA